MKTKHEIFMEYCNGNLQGVDEHTLAGHKEIIMKSYEFKKFMFKIRLKELKREIKLIFKYDKL